MSQIYSDMKESRTYYIFLGFHSFLIGLFPFFLPVFLVKSGYSLSDVSWLIGLTGFSFCGCLVLLERFIRRFSFFTTLVVSFCVELLLLFLLTVGFDDRFLPLLAIINGVYNCLFWMVQRILFYSTTSAENSGRKFGNFQIFVTVVLKAGIFAGGLILEKNGVGGVFLVSALAAVAAVFVLMRSRVQHELPLKLREQSPLVVREVITFTDSHRSRLVFSLDGVFLYLESYFWLISLFYLVRQSFWQLGLLVIVLAVAFSMLFFSIKNRIDRKNRQWVYVAGVVVYTLSWLMRSSVNMETAGVELYAVLLVITFCTSFFRLAFNKRFFDIARTSGEYSYIFCKSYYSQFFLALFFCAFAVFFSGGHEIEMQLRMTYGGAALLAPLYLMYREVKGVGRSSTILHAKLYR